MGQTAICSDDGRLSIWYERPALHLSRYISAYDSYRSDLPPGEVGQDVLPPAWASIRFMLGDGYWGAKLGRRNYDPGPRDALFGPSSHAGFSRYGSMRVVCAGLTPLGWARFVAQDASLHADRIVDADAVWPRHASALRAAVEKADDPAAAFDAYFTDLLDRTEPEEPEIARLLELLLDPAMIAITEMAERMDMNPRTLGRLSARHFGFTPKLLLRRARFMRAMIQILRTDRGGWGALVHEAGYHDQSHFVRDCQLFLDMPMSAFVQRPKPMFEASLRLRAAVLGTPAQALHPAPQCLTISG
ncbi:MAG TPA: helix-turn-helix domain-containing protein [Sphingomonas sp.]